MAYKNVKNVSLSTNKPETLYRHIRDFLTATGLYNTTTGVGGWTAVYNYEQTPGVVTANDWCWLKTTGESGLWDFRVFMKVTSSGIISNVNMGLYNTSGTNPSFVTTGGLSTEAIATPANWTAFYLYADKDFCTIVVRAGTTNYIHRFGIALCYMPGTQADPQTLAVQASSGVPATFTVPNATREGWAVNNRMIHCSWDRDGSTNGGRVEVSKITAVNTGTNQITVDSLTYIYPVGSMVASVLSYVIDSTVAKITSTYITGLSQNADSNAGWAAQFALCVTPNVIADNTSMASSYTGGGVIAHPIILSMYNFSGVILCLPLWNLLVRKRTIEEEVFNDGTNDYRYFSIYNDTTTYGLLMKEV